MRKIVIILCFLFFALLINYCGSTKDSKFSDSLPNWVLNIPYEEGKIYAVGSAGRTLFQNDAWKSASDAARSELAKNLQGRIENAFLSVQSTGGANWAVEAYVVEATSWSTDIVMNNSQILALWYDEKGVVPGGQSGTTYALAVLNISSTEKALKPKIENDVTPEQYEKIIESLSKDFGKKD